VELGSSASYIALWILVLFQGFVALALLRQLADLRPFAQQVALHKDQLPLGTPGPEFDGRDFGSGRQVSIQDLVQGGVILFLSSGCSACKSLANTIGRGTKGSLPTIIAFCQGAEDACGAFVAPEIPLILERAAETAERYRIAAFPTAVVLDGERKIRGYGHPQNAEDLNKLVASSLGQLVVNQTPEGTTLIPSLSQ